MLEQATLGWPQAWLDQHKWNHHNVPKILNRLLEKGTLLQFNTKMFITKALEDYTEMGKMVSKQLTEHQDII